MDDDIDVRPVLQKVLACFINKIDRCHEKYFTLFFGKNNCGDFIRIRVFILTFLDKCAP